MNSYVLHLITNFLRLISYECKPTSLTCPEFTSNDSLINQPSTQPREEAQGVDCTKAWN